MPARGAVNSADQSSLRVQPGCDLWMSLLNRRPEGSFAGRSLAEWRKQSRRELGLDESRLTIATGHQTLLWHPRILAKYLVTEAFAREHDLATANLVVDQHAEGFGDFDVPMRRADGSLGVRKIELCRPRPRKDVPMGIHEAFTPPRPPPPEKLDGAIPSVNDGVHDIFEAVYAHRNAKNAALQMAGAIADLMKPWVRPMVDVTSTALINTSLARAIMQQMARDPRRCAECYNRAVQSLPEAGIGPLMVRDDYVELPLWRIRDDDRRMHAYDADIEEAISDDKSKIQNPKSKIKLMPRALFMTALVRLAMCDLFIHGTGGANYDRAMERWIKDWLGIDVGSIAVATADMRLPLGDEREPLIDVDQARHEARRAWHNPLADGANHHPSDRKAELLASVADAPRDSAQRRTAFLAMHVDLAAQRQQREAHMANLQSRVDTALRQAADAAISQRRDWAFPLFPREMIDALNTEARRVARCAI